MTIQVQKDLHFAAGKKQLDIQLTLEAGTFLVVSGASGSGKTTLLRILAGLEKAVGKIEVNGTTWLDTTQKINRSPQNRKVGLVFQQYTLFPNMTVQQNLVYALEKNQPIDKIKELMSMMELTSFAHQYPFHLSGGQQQRVALARALVRQPTLLLLDEPLSALDDTLRSRLQDYILKIHQQFELTTIMVSHDLGEIFKMADRVVVLQEGKIDKMGAPAKVYFEGDETANFQLVGKVLSIASSDSMFQAMVKVGEQLFAVELSKELHANLTIGETILLVGEALTIRQKI